MSVRLYQGALPWSDEKRQQAIRHVCARKHRSSWAVIKIVAGVIRLPERLGGQKGSKIIRTKYTIAVFI